MRHLAPLAAAFFLIAATPGKVPEPTDLWQGAMHGYTPNTVAGATVLDTAALSKLLVGVPPLMVDVAEADKKPAGMAATALWMPAHRSIPGATWLPGAGSGSSEASFVDAFEARFAALMGGDRSKPIVAFCHPECWGSWNAAKRLVGLGYTKVYWYPEGMEGWQAQHDTAIVKADPQWPVFGGKPVTQ
ncbi:rhodanese-like domain-containing protein [Beijerinckia sp. L45]|uniref:rhodanese-like domain-containing protein n=1 Tax=Beijerinckia sp. L45 TaxID=1641855 RepID=UPI00131DE309|nr:rhodanese-like domain-containing protein [Beijerinckia sp. L45]